MRRCLSLCLVLVMALAVLPGCASKYGEKKTAVNYYPQCYAPIQDLRDREHDVAKSTAGGAAVGALGGALIGFLASGGKWQGAVAGAATGAVTGAVAGNVYASKQKEADDNKRLASYLQDIDGDISKLNVETAAARTSLQCYDRSFSALVSQIKARSIDRTAAQKRFGEITSGREEAMAILGDAISNARNLNQQYEDAFVNEERDMRSPQKAAQGRTVAKQKANAISSARKANRNLSKSISEAEQLRAQANTQNSADTQQFQALMASAEGTRT